jgi:hypothetical protein
MASFNEVSWQSAYYALPPIALNSMLQPAGRICGFDASLQVYLRSSPILCAMDAVFILIRFALYTYHGHSPGWAAREIINARGLVDEDHKTEDLVNEEPKPRRLLSSERNIYLLYLPVVVGVVTQLIKLTACSGVRLTQLWGWFYFLSFIMVEVTHRLGKAQKDTKSKPAEKNPLEQQERRIDFWETVFGAAAILLQLGILAWVDMRATPPGPISIRRWTFISVRFGAHFAVCLIHLPFMLLKLDAAEPLPDKYKRFLLISVLIPRIISASTQNQRFSQLYFMVSVLISYFSWTLYFFPVTKKYVLFCKPATKGHQNVANVLAFDFFCRILCFPIFWYAVHYDPAGTFKPPWTNNLG